MEASATDSGGVARVDFYVGESLLDADATAPFGVWWDSLTVSDGTHRVSAQAYDEVGNHAADSVIVTVENQAATTTSTTVATTTTTQASTSTTASNTTTTTADRPTTTATTQSTTTTTLPLSVLSFSDVPTGHRFYREITYLTRHGILSGYGNGQFGPANPVLRAQFAKIIANAANVPEADVAGPDHAFFTDVRDDGSDYPYTFVERAAQAGLIRGFSNGTFGPYMEITRAQLALMLVRAGASTLATPPPGYSTGFDDTTGMSGEAQNAVAVAKYNGLLSGKTATTFDPYSSATRGHVAKMTFNLLAFVE